MKVFLLTLITSVDVKFIQKYEINYKLMGL